MAFDTTVANLDFIAVKDLVKRVFLGEVLVNQLEKRFFFVGLYVFANRRLTK